MAKKVVAVVGSFDPITHIGHLEHIRKAKELGDYLVVILNPDEDSIRKHGTVCTPLGQRYRLLKDNRYVDEVVIAIDGDGTCANTLRMVQPDIFAKGGDRTPETMPKNELEACEEIGCQIVYGVGKILDSNTRLLKRMQEYKGEIMHNTSGSELCKR